VAAVAPIPDRMDRTPKVGIIISMVIVTIENSITESRRGGEEEEDEEEDVIIMFSLDERQVGCNQSEYKTKKVISSY